MLSLLPMLLLLPAILMEQSGPSLASLKYNRRALLVFAPSDQDRSFQQQRDILTAHTQEMQDLDLVALPMITTTGQDQQQTELRHRFHVLPEQFVVILVGKDGGEKLRRHSPLTAEQLEQTIDAMPMRKDEMRRRSNP